MSQNAVTRAFELAKEKLDSFAVVCGILDISNSYAYKSMNEGEISLPCALKLEVMVDGQVSWRDLCPKVGEQVRMVEDRVAQY